MPLPFSSLRANLIAAFVAVIAVSLLLASGAFAYLLQQYQADNERDRLENATRFYSSQVWRLLAANATQDEVNTWLDQSTSDTGFRVLLLDDRGTVLHDTADNLWSGRTVVLPQEQGRQPNILQGVINTGRGQYILTWAPVGHLGPDGRGPTAALRVAVVSSPQTLSSAWWNTLRDLSRPALIALVVSIFIAWWLASTITRPIVQITRASEEMTRGNLDPKLALPETTDEVGRLSHAFTTMAREVARSHRAMRDLLANVSHDLRTPLTSISGFAGALVDGTLAGPEGAREAGRIIGEEAERMRRLVEDLLYLGRIESGDLALHHEPVDLAELVRSAQPRFAFRAQEVGIAFVVNAPEPITIVGDPHRLAQVVDNLIDNAFKHTPPTGRVEVSVVHELPRPSGHPRAGRPHPIAVLRVHNTGSFIAPDEAERVFERFYQVDKARTARQGRGLGLAIACEIVQAHAGRIDVESTPEAGTSFIVRIPELESSELAPLPSAEPVRSTEATARR